MTRVIFLGTNGWYDTRTGNTISILVETPSHFIILDAGSGISKIDHYISDDRPVFLFLSHFHLDHVAGLHTLSKNQFPLGLTIIVQDGGEPLLHRIMSAPYTIPVPDLPFNTKVIEVPRDLGELPFEAKVLPLEHSATTLGIRLALEDGVITYCPDTGPCENAVILSRRADLLIAECAFLPDEIDRSWPHLNPGTAAEIAKQARVGKLVLTHFDASRYPDKLSRENAEECAQEIFPESYASWDDMELVL